MDVGNITAVLVKKGLNFFHVSSRYKVSFLYTHFYFFQHGQKSIRYAKESLNRQTVSNGWGCTGRWADGKQPCQEWLGVAGGWEAGYEMALESW